MDDVCEARGGVRLRSRRRAAGDSRALARYAVGRVRRMAQLLARRLGDVIDEQELTSCGAEVVARSLRRHDASITPLRPYLDQRLRWGMLHEARRRRRRRLDAKRGVPAMVAGRYRDQVPIRVRHNTPEGETPTPSLLDRSAPRDRTGQWYLCANLSDTAVAREDSAEMQLQLRQRATMLRQAVVSLKPRLRLVVEGHYFEHRSFTDIARELGLSRSAVCRLHKLALQVLSKRFPAAAR